MTAASPAEGSRPRPAVHWSNGGPKVGTARGEVLQALQRRMEVQCQACGLPTVSTQPVQSACGGVFPRDGGMGSIGKRAMKREEQKVGVLPAGPRTSPQDRMAQVPDVKQAVKKVSSAADEGLGRRAVGRAIEYGCYM